MHAITVIAGLGNPGEKYADTRHNAGFWFVDELARRHSGVFRYERRHDVDACRIRIDDHEVWLVKPLSYMNESGGPLRSFLDYYRLKPVELLIAHDEIDLAIAEVRIKKSGGHGGHNGLRDSIACLGKDFVRLRIGVGHPGHKDQVVSYVLKRASAKEQSLLDETIQKAADVAPLLIKRGVDRAMNKLNARPKPKKEPSANEPARSGAKETNDGD